MGEAFSWVATAVVVTAMTAIILYRWLNGERKL